MGIRRTAIVMAAVLLISGVVIYSRRQSENELRQAEKMFVTIDEGKTFFVAPADSLPPFQHEGKTAYRAFVFTCDGGKTKWVGYISRYSDRGKAVMAEMREKQTTTGGPPDVPADLFEGVEVAKPGENEWVRQSDAIRAYKVTNVRCPNAPDKEADPVLPQ